MQISHSACPAKINIYAPSFELKHTYSRPLAGKIVSEYECSGCKTVILVGVGLGEEESPAPAGTLRVP